MTRAADPLPEKGKTDEAQGDLHPAQGHEGNRVAQRSGALDVQRLLPRVDVRPASLPKKGTLLMKTIPFKGADTPNPTPEQLGSPEFEAIWQTIKSWDVNVPEFYEGYCGANGSHVALILNALEALDG
jgi:hypothetical protein